MRTPLSKYDYGYLYDGGVDWYGGVVVQGGYYGPPFLWWSALAALLFRILFWATAGWALTGVAYG